MQLKSIVQGIYSQSRKFIKLLEIEKISLKVHQLSKLIHLPNSFKIIQLWSSASHHKKTKKIIQKFECQNYTPEVNFW